MPGEHYPDEVNVVNLLSFIVERMGLRAAGLALVLLALWMHYVHVA